jgi:Zn-finger nucleic acid-binding protein
MSSVKLLSLLLKRIKYPRSVHYNEEEDEEEEDEDDEEEEEDGKKKKHLVKLHCP